MAPWRARNQAAVRGDSTRQPQRLKKWLAGTLSAALGLGMLAGVATKAYAEEPITGTVFRDFNANGTLDPGDRGLKDVTVTAFNAAGDAIKTVETDKDGLYTLSVPNGQPVRVEFSEWDPHYHPTSAAQAGTNGTSVQFVMPGSTGVDFSLNAPEDYVQDEQLSVIGSIMTASEADDGATSWRNSVYGLAWESDWAAPSSDRPTSTTKPGKSGLEVDLGSNSKTGSLWGSAYDRVGNNAYVSASLKRQAGLGPLGLGGIYRVPNVLKADNTINIGTSVQRWLDVEGLPVVGGDTIELGVDKLENRQAIPKPGTPYADPIAYKQAGKVGIGGLEATPDGKYLIFTNLHDRNLYALDLTTITVDPDTGEVIPPAEAIRIPLELPEHERPWAVTIYRDKLYVGTVQTGEGETTPVQATNYNAFVKSVAIDQVLYGGLGGAFVEELAVPLGYGKGQASGDGTRGDINNKWHTWTDRWSWAGGSVASPQPNSNDGWHSFPQAILSEIEFDVDGYMTMAFLDRTSIQSAVRNYASDADNTGDTRLYNTQSGGDLLIAALDDEGDWKLESNGKVGDRQGTQHANANPEQGPDGHEFYRDMQNMSSVGGDGSNHQEIGLGGLASHPGQNKVGATVYDPRVVVNTSGLNWFNSANGFATHGIDLDVGPSSVRTAGPYNENNLSGFGKGGGLGDIVSILRAAPVEIGNRTWLDLDGDGIQDAGEPSIIGVTVELWAADEDGNPTGDAPIATKITDGSGTYYFRSDVDGFNATGDYVVVFKPGTTGNVALNWHDTPVPNGFVEPIWPQVTFTDQGAGDVDPSVEFDADNPRRDSNPNPLTGNAPVTVNGPGKNNHTVDAGWRYGTVSVGDFVWVDENHNGIQDETEPGIKDVLFKIFLVDGENETELTTDAFGNPFTKNRTDENGKYIFENLPVLTGSQYYKVQIVADDAQTAQALEIYEPTDPGIGEEREVDSNTGFATTQDIPADQALTQHGREDMSLDFGFVKLVPSAVILKNDGDKEADVPGDAVDLTTPGSVAGTSPLRFQVRNTSVEPLHDVVVTDEVMEGDAKVVGLVCEFEQGTQTEGVYDEASNKWTVTWANSFADAGEDRKSLPVDGTFKCTATLTGVVGDHKNVATITGTGAKSGTTVQEKPFDPANPESPGTDNPFHAKRTPAVSVGDRVWEDTIDPDLGIQDRDADGKYLEPGIDGVVLEIVGPDGNPVKSVVTGEDVPNQTTKDGGFYKFEDLPVLAEGESYTVKIVSVPAEYKPTTEGTNNGSEEFDSSTDESSSVLPLTSHGQHDPTLDFGFVKKTPGADVIKTDGNGRDANTAEEAVDVGPSDGETKINFTVVNHGEEDLTNIGLVDETTKGSGAVQYPISCEIVDADPVVEFTLGATERWNGLLPVDSTLLCETTLTGVKPGESHLNTVTLLAEGENTKKPVEDPENPGHPPNDPFNAKYKTYAIGDYVWIDSNGNGVQDEGEQPYKDGTDVRLWKLDEDGYRVGTDPVATTTTNSDGYYLFDSLVAGDYQVEFKLPSEYLWTTATPGEGGNATNDSNAVWTDDDQEWAASIGITLNDNSPLTQWADAAGSKDGKATEGIDQTWDAGLVLRTYAIGDVVWIDRNEDGKQDDGESPIAGVVVNLLDGQGKPILDADDNPVSTETDAEGRYLFDELPKGEYIVEFELPDGHRWTTANATGEGVTDENNSDAVHDTPTSATARTGVIKLGNDKVDPNYTDRTDWTATEGVDPTWDGGVVPLKVSVGDYVWVDDGDGIQNDGDDSGLNGVTLSLQVKRADGKTESVVDVWKNPVGPTTTADKDGKPGYYEFKDLPVLKDGESYIVTISNVPDKYKPTKEGTDNGSGADDSSTGTATSVEPLDKDGLRDPTLDFGFVLKTPSGTVNKSDAGKNDANTVGEAVDLGPLGGETTIVFTIENNGEEPLTNIGLADATVTGGGQVVYPIVLTLPGGSTVELADADARWDGTLAVGDSITGTAKLTGVEEGRGSHQNVVTLWAEGQLTGKPVEDPDNPSEDPDNPNRPNDPYNAEKLTYAIGDYVWVDRNKNGQQDAGEKPIEGVRVNLLDGDGNPITDADSNAVYTETDEDGLYFFDRLPAGTYVVEFELPDGYRFTTQNAEGVGHASNSDADETTGRTGPIVLGPSNTNLDQNYDDQAGWNATEGLDPTLDAGVVRKSVSVGDFVWHDLNDNGIQDDGEPGIEKVTLTLTGPDGQPVTNVYGELVDPVETDGAGHYVFEDLPVLGEGESYTVKISDVPAKYKPAKPGEGDDPAKDSSTGSETSKPLTKDGDEDMTLDFGFVLKTPGADVVKADVEGRDANSANAPADLSPTKGKIDIEFTIVNGGEEPITNIALVDKTTAGSGTVEYPLVCTPPSGVEFELENRSDSIWMVDGKPGVLEKGETITCVGTLDGVVAGDPHTDVVTLWADGVHTKKPVVDPENPGTPENPNRPNDPYNAVVKTYAIGDYVWIDQLNPNGIQDEGEPGIAGVIVTLYDEKGDQVGKPVTTGEDGYYQFDNLEPGKYTVKFDLPTGYVLVPENAGDDRGLDSDAIASDPSLRTSGSTVQVTLDDTNTALVERDGVNATEGIDPTWDAGVRKYTFAIGDVVWIDRNEDGKQDDGEPRLEGVVVNLLDGKGNPIKDANGKPVSTETDANGLYLFDELPQGDYIVEFELPDGYYWTTANATGAGVTDENNSDAVHDTPNSATARTGVITLGNDKVDPDYSDQTGWKATQGVDPTWDAGVVPASVWVGDLVWFDTNGNGIQDDNEPGIDGAVLTLTGPDGKPVKNVYGETVPPYTTGPDGHYEFKDLPVLEPGQSYTVTVTAPDEYKPTRENQGGDPAKDSSTGSAKSGDLTENGASDPTLDFGFVKKQPGGTVVKTDGVNDANTADKAVDLGPAGGTTPIKFTITNTGEEPITNIGLVDVSTGSGVVDYPFTCVAPGNVKFTLANSDARWDGQLDVGDEIVCSATLSGVVAGQPHTNVVTLWAKGSGTGDPVQDPDNPGTPEKPNRPSDPYNAVVKTYAIGDVVWIDKNKNGQQDAGEKPIEGVTVNLLNSEGRVVATTKTDKNGLYLFDNLVAGEYTVEFKLPDGYRFTTQNAEGVPAGANSDANVTTGRTGSIKLGNNAVTKNYTAQDWTATEGVDPTWDAGVVPESVSVGDYVWHDLNGDGVQDAGEPGIQNVTLTLTGPDGKPVTNVYGEPVKPVQTDANRKYVFTDLPVLGNGEKYTVTISNVPDKFKPTKPGVGDPAKDSSTGSATSGSLTKDGAEDMTLDFGFVLKDPGAVIVKMDEKGRDGNSSTDPVDLTPERGTIDIDFTVVNNGDEPITNIGLVDQTTAGSGKVNYPLTCEVFDAKGAKTDSFTLTGANDRWRKPVSEAAVQSESDDSVSSVEDGQPVTEEANASEDTTVTLASVESFGVLGIGESIRCTGTLSGVVAGKPHTDVVTLWADGVHTKKPVVDPANPGTPEKPNRPSDPYNAAVKSYAIGDYVWIDQLHPNGVQDADEPGLPGVTVVLLDEQGNKLATTTTGPDGYYQFDNLAPGTYQVRFELPAGYVLIAPDQGNDDTVDSDALPIAGTNGTQGKTILVTLDDTNTRLVKRPGVNATEGIDPTWDAGVRMAKVTVGDYVWKDTNRDGLQGDPADEPGIPGVVLTIERSDGKPVTNVYGEPVGPTTTDSNGKYEFTDLPLLPEGVHYTVKIDREKSKDALGDLAPTTPGVGNDPGRDSSTWQENATGLKHDGDKDMTLDFGFVEPSVTVGDRVWEDSNKDGRQNAGEPGIPGVVVEIFGPDGKPVTDVFGNPVGPVTTDEHGNYLFPNLPALKDGQSYTVKIDKEASADALKGFEPTKPGVGDRAGDSSTWEATTEGLTSNGDKDLTLDFGFVRPSVTVGDKVWNDTNRDGRQNPGEPGIPGVVVEIFGPDGEPVTDVYGNPVGPVTTDSNGKYEFTDLPILPEGQSYTVKINVEKSKDALGNKIPTKPGVGDREGDSSNWEESTKGLNADGDKDLTLDFGFVTPSVTVGDKVWLDKNGNGRQDFGEKGIPGVVLNIVGPDGKPLTDVYGNPV